MNKVKIGLVTSIAIIAIGTSNLLNKKRKNGK